MSEKLKEKITSLLIQKKETEIMIISLFYFVILLYKIKIKIY